MNFRITPIDGGVCVVDGIYASGVNAGFKSVDTIFRWNNFTTIIVKK